MKNYKALFDQVVVKPIKPKETTDSGIILSVKMTDKIEKGEVLLVGAGLVKDGVLIPSQVKIGDTVAFPNNVGTKVKLGDIDIIIMREGEVYGIYE